MTFSVVLVNGGDFTNIDAPLELEAASMTELTKEVKANFGLDDSVDLIITYCGLPIVQLPRPGAPLLVSVKPAVKSAFTARAEGDVDSKNAQQVAAALEYIRHNMDRRRPPGHREKVLSVAKNVLERRWKKYPDLCRRDGHGANLCSSLERFMKCLEPGVIRKHEIIVQMVLDIHRIAQQKMLNTVQAKPAGTNQASNAQSFINAALGQGASSSMSSAGITQDMLTQALQSVQATMQATGQSAVSPDGANQGLAQAAQGVVSEIAALAQAVDRGITTLREMGILDLTTEAEARRILQDNGGNVEAAVNAILQ